MAQVFPRAVIKGFDYHPGHRDRATRRQQGRDGPRGDAAKTSSGTGYDLVTFFDCLHDMGDPVGAARHVCESLAPGGTWILVEPLANDRIEDNFNPVGRLYCAATPLRNGCWGTSRRRSRTWASLTRRGT
jgi:hypothetical protein